MQSFHIPGWTETWNYKLPNKLIGEKMILKLLLNFKSTETTSCSVSNMISFKIFFAKTGTESTPSSAKQGPSENWIRKRFSGGNVCPG